jgi:NitT/TauT family transport system permease protein
MKNWLPILIVLIALILLGYPLALLFGLPLARRDRADILKWQKETVTAQAPLDVSNPNELPFASVPENAVLILDGKRLETPFTVQENKIILESPVENLVAWGKTLENASGRYYSAFSFGEAIPEVDPNRILYSDNRLLIEGWNLPNEVPDGLRKTFTFNENVHTVIVDSVVFVDQEPFPDADTTFEKNGQQITLNRPPAFGSRVRALTGDYAVLDANAGVIVTSVPFPDIRIASSVIRLAEPLQGEVNGENKTFSFAKGNVVESDRERAVYLNERRLSDAAERPNERVDGKQTTFTFPSDTGFIVMDDVLQDSSSYERSGNSVTFATPPKRNAELRQYADYFVTDFRKGEITLAEAPTAGSTVWASQYTVYSQPACGKTVLECFYNLPQHPLPFPHWIAQKVPSFFTRYPVTDERSIVRASLYTTIGTLASLILGGIVGSLLAVLFVMFRPLERALLPWTIASQTIPIIALVPVMLLILGNFGITIQTSLLPTAIIGAYICFFPVVVSTVKGLRSVDPLTLDLMKSYAATPLQVFRNVRFPAAVPFVFTGLKLGTAAALVGALVAETQSNNKRGLGFQILGQVQTGNVADVWILLIISALLGVGLVSLVGLLQRLVAPWERR